MYKVSQWQLSMSMVAVSSAVIPANDWLNVYAFQRKKQMADITNTDILEISFFNWI